ncbi:MAG: acyltransferase family protein, partial [Ilumatobacteraceae bacterium]
MTDRAEPPTPRLTYQPALDGLRGVAVAMVVVFHGGFGWMRGGYVGVSIFFTLSGYLITALLIAEHDRVGRISLSGFYARRCKRLLPASLVTLALVAIGASAGWFAGVAGMRRDLLGSLFQVENWVKLFGHTSYADLTTATLGRIGPLEHYWSLAVEEQFYWLWPLAMLALLRFVRRPARRLAALGGLAVAGAVAAFVVAGRWGSDAAYWATPARLGEILVGAAVAGLLAWRPRLPRWTRWGMLPATLVIGWAATSWSSGSGPAYAGWLPVFALASAAVIVALQQPSPVRTALSWAPLVWLGGVSYAVYLFHWPVYAALVDAGLGWSRVEIFVVEVGITLAAAALSSLLLERPVRQWSASRFRPVASGAAAMAVVATLVVALVAVPAASSTRADASITPVDGTLAALAVATSTTTSRMTTTPTPSPTSSSTPTSTSPVASAVNASTRVASPTTAATTPTRPTPSTLSTSRVAATAPTTSVAVAPTQAPPPLPVLTRPVRILVVGDSTAEATGVGLVKWAATRPDLAQVTNDGLAGCGFLLDGTVPTDGGMQWKAGCRTLLEHQLPKDVARLQPDVVMLMVTMRDAEDRIFTNAGGLESVADPEYRSRLESAYAGITATLTAAGVPHVVWVLAPYPSAPFAGAQAKMRDPARYEVLHEVIRSVAATAPERIGVVDLDGWMHALGLLDDTAVRADGLHFTPAAATALAENYLGPLFI